MTAPADRVIEVMREAGLERGRAGLQVYVIGEIPSNVIRAAEFARRFDGFSIGSNDLTQLTLGVDRNSEQLAELFSEADPSVIWMIETLIDRAHESGAKVGLCGQAPSNDPTFARRLVRQESTGFGDARQLRCSKAARRRGGARTRRGSHAQTLAESAA